MRSKATLSLVLLLTFVSLFLAPALVRAQGIDWSDPNTALWEHPEIIQEVFTAYGFSVPSDALAYQEVFGVFDLDQGWISGSFCEYTDAVDGTIVNAVREFNLWFRGEMYQPMDSGTDLQLSYENSYQLEGLNVIVTRYINQRMPEEFLGQQGWIELAPGSGIYQEWYITETCIKTYGETLPRVEDVLLTFLRTLKNYGYLSAEDQGIPVEPLEETTEELPPVLPGEEYTQAVDDDLNGAVSVPALAGGLAVGSLVGIGLAQVVTGLSRRAAKPAAIPPGMAYSPATNQLVPEEQAYQEKLKLRDGWSYAPDRGGWLPPTEAYAPTETSIVTKEANALIERQKAEHAQWERENAARQEKARAEAAKQRPSFKEWKAQVDQRRRDAAWALGQAVAEFAVDTAVSVLITKRVKGKYIQFAVEESWDLGKIVVKNLYRGVTGRETKWGHDMAVHVLTIPVRLAPSLAGDEAPLSHVVAEESARTGTERGIEYTYDQITGNPKGGAQ